MIIEVNQINMPDSGMYNEVIYNIPSTWNSQEWTWLKFTNDDYSEWCGEFRGKYMGHGISKRDNCIYILTYDYLYLLDIQDGKLLKYQDKPDYKKLTIFPKGDCIVASYYHIEIIDTNLDSIHFVKTPIELDMIEFSEWNEGYLTIYATEFLNLDKKVILKLNHETFAVSLVYIPSLTL